MPSRLRELIFSACSLLELLTSLTSPELSFSSSPSPSLSESEDESESESDESVEELASALLLACVFVFTGDGDFCPSVVSFCFGVCFSPSLLLEDSLAAFPLDLDSDSDPESESESDSEEDELSLFSGLFWLDMWVF